MAGLHVSPEASSSEKPSIPHISDATVMMDDLRFTLANRSRIHAVESSFGPAGKSLFVPGRVLVGEGRLTKLCRRRPQPKVFFLFNDILVYGSIVVPGRWNNNQKIIRLVEVHQEDLLDGVGMTNQWLLRTPRKSFHVSAASSEEKQAWMQHIEQCRVQQLQNLGVPAKGPSMDDFAAIWIPDNASAVCMRCTDRFHVTNRRHHCRHCGFVVCGSCSKSRAVLRHISSKPVRVCWVCKASMQEDADKQQKQSWKCNSMEDTPEYETSSDEEEDDDNHVSNHWFSTEAEGLATYCYLNPSHTKPPLSLRRAGQGTCRLNPAHTSTTVLTLPTSVHCVHSPGGTFQRL
ncbi:pleckstrin homology domain-containing family F member 1 isoform X2 [Electrophorus electricus]|uniref:pleckstrin homology domain-containing family F member 1 isoform X2 n=1 Tax=Electrophorus electricus TaxID=8005 RepID=UPI0015CFDE54|nr:pleckstrin homology domain-containing family F member 1 isoform X2 [Electrophorus electricus]